MSIMLLFTQPIRECTIDFKEACTPVEVYEQKAYGENVNSIDVEMHFGETKMWKIQ